MAKIIPSVYPDLVVKTDTVLPAWRRFPMRFLMRLPNQSRSMLERRWLATADHAWAIGRCLVRLPKSMRFRLHWADDQGALIA